MMARAANRLNLALFRGGLLFFTFLLACQAIWILTAELSSPSLPNFPDSAQTASVAVGDRNAAARAARYGITRGDLWATYALTYLNLVQAYESNIGGPQDSKMIRQAREVSSQALSLSPYDARIWLVLAATDMRLNGPHNNSGAALRMSYYTGANESELIPFRLLLAVASPAIVDKDFQQLVRHDVRVIITRKPELKSAVLAAYRNALPFGRKFLEKTLEEINPALLVIIRTKGQ